MGIPEEVRPAAVVSGHIAVAENLAPARSLQGVHAVLSDVLVLAEVPAAGLWNLRMKLCHFQQYCSNTITGKVIVTCGESNLSVRRLERTL